MNISTEMEIDEDKHLKLWKVCKKLHSDFRPYGLRRRDGSHADALGINGGVWDCSCGCKFYIKLEGKLGADWGICSDTRSPRAGLLTFEHQGCKFFEYEEKDEEWIFPKVWKAKVEKRRRKIRENRR